MKTDDSWNRYYGQENSPGYKRYGFAVSHLFGEVLDVGCGDGFGMYLMDKNKSITNIFGIDIQNEAIKMLKKNIPGAKVMKASAEELPFTNNSFDCVHCGQTLEHVKNDEQVISEIERVVKCRAVFSVPINGGISEQHVREYKNEKQIEDKIKKYFNIISKKIFIDGENHKRLVLIAEKFSKRKIFIDIGGWNGVSAEFFRNTHPQGKEFEIYIFECDHRNIDVIKKKNLPVTLIEKAAWITNGMVKFYYANAGTKAGGTLYPTKKTGHVNRNNFYIVPCIDIVEFIRQFAGCYIIMKLNCEGAEYDIIPHLKNAGMLSMINKFYVQWHWDKIGLSKERHNEVAGMINSHPWDCQFNAKKFKEKFMATI